MAVTVSGTVINVDVERVVINGNVMDVYVEEATFASGVLAIVGEELMAPATYPTNFSLHGRPGAAGGDIFASWDDVAGATSYGVRYQLDGQPNWAERIVADDNTYFDFNTPNTVYNFQIRAINSAGTSGYSPEKSKNTNDESIS